MPGRFAIAAALILACLCGALPTHAQKATERYIPLGHSPGLSGKSTTIGQIEAVDAGRRTLHIAGPAGAREVAITDGTTIWLDRTRLGLSNTEGAMTDCRRGLTAEVKYQDPARRRLAEWIKLRLDEPATGP